METQPNGSIIPLKDNETVPTAKPPRDVIKTKKRGGALQMVRAALFMLRKKSKAKKTESLRVEVASSGMWKEIVGSMRPLHLQNHDSPPAPLAPTESGKAAAIVVEEQQYEDVYYPPFSPSAASMSSSSDSMSRYASAQNLQDLDVEETPELDEEGADLKIDAKAEAFISHFYESMKLQRAVSYHRYNERLERATR